ncbi:dynamin family protein [Thermodesulfobacteriota bacterium]
MEPYNALKEDLLTVNQEISLLFSDAKTITGLTDDAFGDWEKTCSDIQRQMSEDMIRVAIVGAVKSGKSTLLNSLFKGDFLKRGAGVVTSIVTRVCTGKSLSAKLYFKNWEDVNTDIEQALTLFPSKDWRSENEEFDIRRKIDRKELQKAIDGLRTEQLITNDTRNPNSVLLASYLKGYDQVKEIISSDGGTLVFEGDQFPEQKTFVGDDALATYLRDVNLQINTNSIGSNIEIADCQGSDSPNPLHLAMIQDYLLLTHLIVYVVSSRTGLRQADIKFLSIIKKMGILDNILFVINCDFSEHETVNELEALVEKITEEISLIKPNPDIFMFSALYNLFKTEEDVLSRKDRQRFEQWANETALKTVLERGAERFSTFFYDKLTRDRNALLLKNHLERLGVIASGVDHWVCVNQDILNRDTTSASEIIVKIKQHQKKMNQIKAMIKSTLDGAVRKVQQELKVEIDRFFDPRSGDVIRDITEFIRNYSISYNDYLENLDVAGFSSTLYLIYQELKQALDKHVVEVINPEIIRFVRQQEEKIKGDMGSIAGPYDTLVQDAIVEYNTAMGDFGFSRFLGSREKVKVAELDYIKGSIGLTLPPLVANMRYSTKIKTEAVMRLGLYAVVNIFKRLFRKQTQNKNDKAVYALKNGVSRMKSETEKSILFLFINYRENLKFQYIIKLLEAASNSLYDILLDRFQAYVTDLSKVEGLIGESRIDKEHVSEVLNEMERATRRANEMINEIRGKIELTV